MRASVRAAVESALAARIVRAEPVSGGDINEAHRVFLENGRTVFVKSNAGAPRAMFPAEARGLAFLADANAIRTPRVLAVSGVSEASEASEASGDETAFLVLEWLESAPRGRYFEERLGQRLAALHGTQPASFGLDHANFIATLSQSNREHTSWAAFYRSERLEPLVRLAAGKGLVPPRLQRTFDDLFRSLDGRVGPPEPPARLHGDLWGGNLHVDEQGDPCLIDPAVYGGHREVDLAMMRLFGGFSTRVFAAYAEAFPLSPGNEERVPLYQLYPLLVHLNIFGGSYGQAVAQALSACV